MNQKKISKCIITGGKEILKDLGIQFQETSIERNERTSEMFVDEKKYKCYADYLLDRIEREGEYE